MSDDLDLRRAVDALASCTGRMSPSALRDALANRTPTFRDSDLPLLVSLAGELVENTAHVDATRWAERLMVFVEVRRNELRARLRAKWRSAHDRVLGALALETVLLAAHAAGGDLRLLNTALKLGDSLAVLEARLRARTPIALQVDRALRSHVEHVLVRLHAEQG